MLAAIKNWDCIKAVYWKEGLPLCHKYLPSVCANPTHLHSPKGWHLLRTSLLTSSTCISAAAPLAASHHVSLAYHLVYLVNIRGGSTYLPTVWKEKSLRVLFNVSGMSLSNAELTPAQEQKSRTYRWSRNAEHSMSLVPLSHSDSQLDNTLPSIQTSCSAWQTYSRAYLIHQLAAWETVNPNVEEKKRILGLAFWNRRYLRGGENSRLLTLSEGSNSIEQHKTSLICEAVPVIGVANGGRIRRCSSAHVRPSLSWP